MNIDMLTQRAVMLLRENEPVEGYYGAFSGGKDSTVIKHIASIAGVRVTWHYQMTTIDPPEVLRFIREQHPDVQWEKPPHGNFFVRFETKKVFPSNRIRWCCDEYKERTPRGATSIVGVRVAESSDRARRYTNCVMDDDRPGRGHRKVMPIRLWSDEDVWQYIRSRRLPYCSLYDEGWKRIGCVGCPLGPTKVRLAELARWPGFEKRWRLAFERFWKRMKAKEARTGKPWKVGQRFGTWENLWEHWVLRKKWPPMPTA